MSFLNGKRTPQIQQLSGASILGLEYVVYLDAGVVQIDWHGIVRNVGV